MVKKAKINLFSCTSISKSKRLESGSRRGLYDYTGDKMKTNLNVISVSQALHKADTP